MDKTAPAEWSKKEYLPFFPADNLNASSILMESSEDLHRLLKLPRSHFWVEIMNSDVVSSLLDTYLAFAARPYEVGGLEVDQVLRRQVFQVFWRLANDGQESLSHGDILYDNWLFDIPKLFDISVLFGKDNEQLVRKLIIRVFEAQPKYQDDFENALVTIIDVLEELETRIGDSSDFSAADVQSKSLSESLFYVRDIFASLVSFAIVFPESFEAVHTLSMFSRLLSWMNTFSALCRTVATFDVSSSASVFVSHIRFLFKQLATVLKRFLSEDEAALQESLHELLTDNVVEAGSNAPSRSLGPTESAVKRPTIRRTKGGFASVLDEQSEDAEMARQSASMYASRALAAEEAGEGEEGTEMTEEDAIENRMQRYITVRRPRDGDDQEIVGYEDELDDSYNAFAFSALDHDAQDPDAVQDGTSADPGDTRQPDSEQPDSQPTGSRGGPTPVSRVSILKRGSATAARGYRGAGVAGRGRGGAGTGGRGAAGGRGGVVVGGPGHQVSSRARKSRSKARNIAREKKYAR